MTYPWRAPVRPRAFTCALTGQGCQYEACPNYHPYSRYVREAEACDRREAEP